MTGTFAVLTETDIQWDPVLFSGLTVIAGGTDTVFSWGLQSQTQSGTSLALQTRACGDTSPDLCSSLLTQAYTQTIPFSIYELSSMPRSSTTVSFSKAPVAGDPFVAPLGASLLGLSVTDPMGTWPTSYTDPSITWLDPDADGHLGVTSFIPTTGTSSACNLPYTALPIPSSGALAVQVYTGSRSLSGLNGTVVDCNTISGNVTGPVAGMPQINGHAVGCLKSDNTACTDAETASLDGTGTNGNRILAARFTMVRVPATTTCAQARALQFP
jgi:hypothetical protein